MFKYTFNFKDFDDNDREMTTYFNLAKHELQEMQLTTVGGLNKHIEKITQAQDVPELYRLFKEIVLRAYGEKSPDGLRFVKDHAKTIEFTQTPAYDMLMDKLVSDDKFAAMFVNQIIPKDVQEQQTQSNVVNMK